MPVYRTPGGQRRFAPEDLDEFIALDARAPDAVGRAPAGTRRQRDRQLKARAQAPTATSVRMTARRPRRAVACEAGALAARRGRSPARAPATPTGTWPSSASCSPCRVVGDLTAVDTPRSRVKRVRELPRDRRRAVLLGSTPAACLGVVDDPRRLAASARYSGDRPADQPRHLRVVPADRRHRLRRRGRGHRRAPPTTRLLPADPRPLRARPRDRLRPDRRLLVLRRARPLATKVRRALLRPAPVRARVGPAGARRRLRLRRGSAWRPWPSSASCSSSSST